MSDDDFVLKAIESSVEGANPYLADIRIHPSRFSEMTRIVLIEANFKNDKWEFSAFASVDRLPKNAAKLLSRLITELSEAAQLARSNV